MATQEKMATMCQHCGQIIENDGTTVYDAHGRTQVWCDECIKKEAFYCDHCGEYHYGNPTPVTSHNGQEHWCNKCVESDAFYCKNCLTWYDNDYIDANTVLNDGSAEIWCQDCVESNAFYCEHCDQLVANDDMEEIHVHGLCDSFTDSHVEYWCYSCRDSDAVQCEDCGDWVSDNFAMLDGNGNNICHCCLEQDYIQCEDCHNWYRSEDMAEYEDGWLCEYCAANRRRVIYGYHDYANNWQFYSHLSERLKRLMSEYEVRQNYLHMGIELEIDRGGENSDNAIAITTAIGFPANESDMLICSHDGSLDNGFEIISNPATLEFHKTQYNWKAGMEEAINAGYVSHNGGTCGQHIHVDREYFHCRTPEAEWRLSLLASNNFNWLEKFSRREKWSYCKFFEHGHSSFFEDFIENRFSENEDILKEFRETGKPFTSKMFEVDRDATMVLVDRVRDYYKRGGHGVAFNFGGRGTLEFRFFRGTLKYNTFIANLELTAMMCLAVKQYTQEELCNVGLQWFKEKAQELNYSAFLSYIEERNITASN